MPWTSSFARSLHAAARRAVGWPFRVAAARATMRALASMDQRELADIGLALSDVRDASALPLDHDPGELLARRASERRRASCGLPPSGRGAVQAQPGPDDSPRRPGLEFASDGRRVPLRTG